jgi:hypothetical protein
MKLFNRICLLPVCLASIPFLNGCWLVHSGAAPRPKPAVLVGNGRFTRQLWAQNLKVGEVTDIRWGQLEGKAGQEWGIAGIRGVVYRSGQGALSGAIFLQNQATHVFFVDLDNDGRSELADRGGIGWSQSQLFDHEGKLLWSDKGMDAVDDMAYGDLDGDRKPEFVVGRNGGGGVDLLDRKGRHVWNKPDGNVWHVEILDTNGDGKNEIVHSNAQGTLTIRNRRGNVLKAVQMKGAYFSQFTKAPYPTASSVQRLIVPAQNQALIYTAMGTKLKTLSAPSITDEIVALPVKLNSSKPDYFAILGNMSMQSGAELFIYDNAGTLIYHETIGEACRALAAASNGTDKPQTLLVGGTNRVWEYRLSR